MGGASRYVEGDGNGIRELAKPGKGEGHGLGPEGGDGKNAATKQPRQPGPVGEASGHRQLRQASEASSSAPKLGALRRERGQRAAQAEVGAQPPDCPDRGANERSQNAG